MVAAFFVAVVLLLCLERVPVGYVGVVYSARGVEQNTLSQGWHFLSPMKHVSKFPISQQQLIFSDDPADYNAKEQAKQDAEIAELNKQTALAQAETDKVKAQTEADVKVIEAQAEAESNRIVSESITPELIQMKEAEARLKHGWVTVNGADTVVTKAD